MEQAAALARWPDVPACHGWLSLDRRGNWRLQGGPVTHRGLLAFLNGGYASDEAGRWFVQNGPQRVYVDLACTPWIYRRRGDSDTFDTHTGQPAGAVGMLYIDPEGNLLIEAERGIGLLDDRDLPAVLAECRNKSGEPADEAAFAALLGGEGAVNAMMEKATVFWHGIALQACADDIADRFGFIRQPRP